MGDSGEFQVLAVTGGLAHATGYPIYLFLAKIFSLLPFGSIAVRISAMSAIMGSIAVAEIYLLSRILGCRRAYAVLGAGILAINPIFWWQSIIAEVYTTTIAVFAFVLILLVVWQSQRNPKKLAIAGTLGGLCWGLHHLAILTFPAVLIYLFVSKANKKDWQMALCGAFAGVAIAMASYSIMASVDNVTTSINSIRPAASGYGLKVEDFDSITTRIGFIMNASEFKGDLTSANQELVSQNFSKYWTETQGGFGWCGLLLICVGLLSLYAYRRWRPMGYLFLFSWLGMLLFVMTFSAFDLEVDFLLGYLILAVTVACGLQGLHWKFLGEGQASLGVRSGVAACAAILLGAGLVPRLTDAQTALSMGRVEFLKGDNRVLPYPVETPTAPHDYANYVIDQVPPNALILSIWSSEWPFYYVAQFEKNKPEVEVIEMGPIDGAGQPTASWTEFVHAAALKRPIYSVRYLPYMSRDYDFEEILPGGLYRVIPRFTSAQPAR